MTERLHLNMLLNTALRTALALAMIALFMIAGPLVERRFFPVWSQMTIEWQAPALGWVYGFKERGTCRLLDTFAMVREGEIWHRATFEIDGRPPRGLTRPDGWQSLGLWHFDRTGDRMRVTAHFSCHELWDTPATLGEWPMPGGTQ